MSQPQSSSSSLRVFVYGVVAPERAWLDEVATALTDARVVLVGACAAIDHLPQLERHADCSDEAHAVLAWIARQYAGDDFMLLRANTKLPPFWFERLRHVLSAHNALVVSPLDDLDCARAPLPAGTKSDASAVRIDACCFAHGRGTLLEWSTFSPLLSAWNGALLRTVDMNLLRNFTLPQILAQRGSMLFDRLYVAAGETLRGPPGKVAGADPSPPSPLGELRQLIEAGLRAEQETQALPPVRAAYWGYDGKPVVLHILHGWGGGAARFVTDLANGDATRHHLVLTARGNSVRRTHGEIIELQTAPQASSPLRTVVLPQAIRSTAAHNETYRDFLDEILRDFCVEAVLVSSLIGHSLDALRCGVPTVLVVHDFYPLWPLLHRDFGDKTLAFDAAQLRADLRSADATFEFAERDADYWLTLRDAYIDAALASHVQLAAPSRSALTNLLRLAPQLAPLTQKIIPHGIASWPAPMPDLAPPPRSRLRLLLLGRVRRGKGAELLRAALPLLREHAEIFLLGAGAAGEAFFGQSQVHVVVDYKLSDLPRLLAQIKPDAALLLPTVAETFSYTLSELWSLGVVPIATRLGALAERITPDVNGLLVAADAAEVAGLVRQLAADPQRLIDIRAHLKHFPQSGIMEMTAAYTKLLPMQNARRKPALASVATLDSIAARDIAGELDEAHKLSQRLVKTIALHEAELQRRGAWGASLDRELRLAQQRVQSLHEENLAQQDMIATRTQWARDAAAREEAVRVELTQFAEVHKQLQSEFEDRTRWALALNVELAQAQAEMTTLRSSASWRLTRPLRFAQRKLAGLRAGLAFSSRRLVSALLRTRGSLARRGVGGTFKRGLIELQRRRSAPRTPTLVATPATDVPFTAFDVPSAADPLVSIVIPVYNKIEYTLACVRSLAEHAGAVAFETIVVDDGSTDSTAADLARVNGVTLVRNASNLGFIGSCNAGARRARGAFLLFLNNDTVVTCGWLTALLECFATEPDAGLVGSKLVYPDGRLQEAGGIVFSDGSGWNYGRFDDPADPRYEFRREVDYCSGAAIMIERATFEQLGGFDPRYMPAYYEDTDLAFAVRAIGKKVFFEPRSVVIHFEGITSGTDVAGGVKKYQTVNRGKFLAKWAAQLHAQPAPIDDANLAQAAANFRMRKRALIVDACTPTPDQDAGSLRMVNFMRLLAERGYRVSFMPENLAHTQNYTQALQAIGIEALYHPFVSDPAAWLRCHGPSLDVIVLSRHYVAINYIGLARLYAPRATIIFDTVDLHYLREERSAALESKRELSRLATSTKRQELKLMREADVTLVVSFVEQQLLAHEVPSARVEVLSTVHDIHGRRRHFSARDDLIFVGGFSHLPNVDAVLWFVRCVFPLVRKCAPAMRLHIVGSKTPDEIAALADDHVIVHGFVPDIEPFMDGCRVSIAPLRVGAGVKGKINTAMSYGLPVVATTLAIEGMHACFDAHKLEVEVLVGDSAAAFAAAIMQIYDDEALWQRISDNGLENVRRHFSFDAAREALAKFLPQT